MQQHGMDFISNPRTSTTIAAGEIYTHPAAQAMRPQFGSCPKTAALVSEDCVTERAIRLAPASSVAPVHHKRTHMSKTSSDPLHGCPGMLWRPVINIKRACSHRLGVLYILQVCL